MSVSVKRMEKAGFIVKKPDENDARIMHIYPTEKAKAVPGNTRKKINELELILKKEWMRIKRLSLRIIYSVLLIIC